jgi:two-component system CitB family sensor kinase
MSPLRTLSSRILVSVLGILLVTVVVGGALDITLTRRSLDQQYEERARAVAAVVAGSTQIRDALLAGDPAHQIQTLSAAAMQAAGASYVVVSDRDGIRYSHPNPALVGRRLEEPVAVLDGRDHVGIDQGSLGRSANGKAAVLDASGRVVGQVSVGIVETRVAAQVDQEARSIALYSLLTLGLGLAVSLLLARAIKRMTFGLELADIRSLLQEREAMLHGIREGVVGLDSRGRVSVLNDEARRLLSITRRGIGEPLADLVGPGRLRDVLTGRTDGRDESILTQDALLVVNRREVAVGGRSVGTIATLRDRTELEALIRRMNAVTGLSNALRAQEHEYTNRLHAIAGLLDLGESDEARHYLDEIIEHAVTSGEDLRARVGPPAVAALLLAKTAVGAERGVAVQVTDDSYLEAPVDQANLLLTVVGNLVDNAIDATSGHDGRREVTVHLAQDGEGVVVVEVTDTGPGVPADAVRLVCTDGWSTKPPRGDLRRGIGLALVERLVTRRGGSVTAHPGPGGRFVVRLPMHSPARPDAVHAASGGVGR